MTASCRICGEIIVGRAARLFMLNPDADKEETSAMVEIAEFDLLAGQIADHLSKRHEAEAQEMVAVSMLAGKVYAMTWAENATFPKYELLRTSWRKAILEQMRLNFQASEPAAAAGSESAS
jgi:hypothetical protein